MEQEIKSNVLYYGDNLIHMQNRDEFPDNPVDLIYVDSQFAPNTTYVHSDEDSQKGHKETWGEGIKSYIEYMKPRLKEMKRILSKQGTIYVHCNYYASAYLRILMDEIFESKNYQTTIVWQRISGAYGTKSNKLFPEVSDYILVYTKSNNFIYNTPYIEHTKDVMDQFQNPDNDPNGKYIWQRFTNGVCSDKTIELNKKSKIKFLRQVESGRYQYKRYFNDVVINGKFRRGLGVGKPIMNVWTDINKNKSKIFPTQKPEELLERIILASSNINSVVLDPFSGSGTTVAVARKYGRKFIGIDYSRSAILLTAKRLGIHESEIIGMPKISIQNPDKLKCLNKKDIQKLETEFISDKDIVTDIIRIIEDYKSPFRNINKETNIHHEIGAILKSRFKDTKAEEQIDGSRPDLSIGKIAIDIKYKTGYYSVAEKIIKYLDFVNYNYLILALYNMEGTDTDYEKMKLKVKNIIKYPDNIIFIRDGKFS